MVGWHCCLQRAHIPKAIMTVLEKDAHDEQRAVEKARRVEEERMTQQEKLYQVRRTVTVAKWFR
jgi:hypothetical protein